MTLKHAVFTVMTPEFTPKEAVRLFKQLGYHGVEWRVHSVPSKPPAKPDFWRGNKATLNLETIVKEAKSVRKLTEDQGLEILGLGTYLSYKLTDDIERCMEAAGIMGAGSIRVSPPGYDGSENYNDLYEEAVDGFGRVEELARQYKVRANVEIHPRGICCSASLSYRLVSNFDPDYIGVILDPGNMMMEGYENWQLGLELLGPYLSHVHVKNSAWIAESASDGAKRWKTMVVPMREGCVSWRDVLDALDRVGYTGWLSLEDLSQGDTRAKLADGLEFLRTLEAEIGGSS